MREMEALSDVGAMIGCLMGSLDPRKVKLVLIVCGSVLGSWVGHSDQSYCRRPGLSSFHSSSSLSSLCDGGAEWWTEAVRSHLHPPLPHHNQLLKEM